mmetsp:Transcript_27315/g.41336  ORF Transcript_27315/g.41336 Transcript_27315/m.41336 type:complete len:428 (+) Transcript_27315:194-1477(+)|eukprot:CAMPEP_0178931770 /NCGR_PEP_ID=MMETSP0786-20121207/22132_1 /TAXON_ID=186022 /ORGANISM="Thalassionema frauenfeldii, Strain CCMP 1798" /LENGTH=427 /DNA_ID=CAMNT_0020608759 /DNA_START=173 /DNA_END=1456 /DNA_ORIENTATION=-
MQFLNVTTILLLLLAIYSEAAKLRRAQGGGKPSGVGRPSDSPGNGPGNPGNSDDSDDGDDDSDTGDDDSDEGAPWKQPDWVPPCGEEYLCEKGNGNGNGPDTYSVCQVLGMKEFDRCLPETSGIFKKPENYCGPCVAVPAPDTPAPFTAPPVTLEPNSEPEEEGAVAPPSIFCFSGSSMVEVENKGYVKMMNLNLGDRIKVNGDGHFEPIYSFGHKDSVSETQFLQITTSDTKKALEVTAGHLVAIEGGHHVPASQIKRGDNLITGSNNNEMASVTNIKTVTRKGIYAPFTASGTIVVNDIIASNYISFQDSEYLQIGSIQTPLSYHWVSHAFTSIHRLVTRMVGIVPETYTEEGISQFADLPKKVFTWALNENAFVFATLLALGLPVITMTWLLEWMLLNPIAISAAVGIITLYRGHNKKSSKKVL